MQLDGSRDLDGITEGVMGAVRSGFTIRGPQDEPVPEAEMQKNLRQQFIPAPSAARRDGAAGWLLRRSRPLGSRTMGQEGRHRTRRRGLTRRAFRQSRSLYSLLVSAIAKWLRHRRLSVRGGRTKNFIGIVSLPVPNGCR